MAGRRLSEDAAIAAGIVAALTNVLTVDATKVSVVPLPNSAVAFDYAATVRLPSQNQANIVFKAVDDWPCSNPGAGCFWQSLQTQLDLAGIQGTVAKTSTVDRPVTIVAFEPPSTPPPPMSSTAGGDVGSIQVGESNQEVAGSATGDGLSSGAVAGVVIGGLAGVILIALAGYLYILKSRYDKANRVMLNASQEEHARDSYGTKVEEVSTKVEEVDLDVHPPSRTYA